MPKYGGELSNMMKIDGNRDKAKKMMENHENMLKRDIIRL